MLGGVQCRHPSWLLGTRECAAAAAMGVAETVSEWGHPNSSVAPPLQDLLQSLSHPTCTWKANFEVCVCPNRVRLHSHVDMRFGSPDDISLKMWHDFKREICLSVRLFFLPEYLCQDGLPPLWPRAPLWPTDISVQKRIFDKHYSKSSRAAFTDFVSGGQRQRLLDTRNRHYTHLSTLAHETMPQERKTLTEWCKLLVKVCGCVQVTLCV
jgi:hypothetical protein